MSKTSLKETFTQPNITEELTFESGLLDEETSSIIGQIVNNQLKKFMKKGQLSLSKSAIQTLKKLNKLGVKKLYGFDLDKAIPALEKELSTGDDEGEDVASVLRKVFGGSQGQGKKGRRYPIMKGGQVVGWRTRKEHMEPVKYKLSSLFLEDLNVGQKEVENDQETRYDNQTPDEIDYITTVNTSAENEVPESPLGDAADHEEEVAEVDVITALTQDNARYGEFDEALED